MPLNIYIKLYLCTRAHKHKEFNRCVCMYLPSALYSEGQESKQQVGVALQRRPLM